MRAVHGNDPGTELQRFAADDTLYFLGELSRQPAIEHGDLDSVIAYVVVHAAHLIDADYLGVWLFDDTRENLISALRFDIKTGRECAPIVLPIARVGSEFSAFHESPMVAIDDAMNDPRAADFRDIFVIPNGITSLLDHAIRASGEDVGAFSFERRGEGPRSWLPSEMALARSISSYLSLTYVNKQRREAQRALRESENRLRATADNLPGAIYQRPSNVTSPFSYVSSGITRFTADQPVLAGQPDAVGWSTFIHPDDLSRVASVYEAASSGTEYAVEYRLRHPGGEEMWVLDRGRKSVQMEAGDALDGFLFNITPRKRAEKAAEGAASLHSAILHNAGYAVIATDAKGTITFFNRAAENLLGYDAKDVVSRQTPLIFHDIGEVQSRMLTAKQHLGRDILYPLEIFTVDSQDEIATEREWIYIRKNGQQISVRLSVTAIQSNDGDVAGFLCIASDVSDRKKLASKLRQSEDIAARVLLQSPDAILITSIKDGRVLEVNPGFEKITGILPADAIGRSTIELNIWNDLDERNAMIDTVRKSGEVTSLPIRINRRGGRVRYCMMWARTFTFNGEPALLSVVHDVTELRLAAQASRDSELMLQAVLDTVPSHVFWKDASSRYLGCNRQFALDSGYKSPADIVGLTEYDLLTGQTAEEIAEAEAVLSADRHIITTGEAAPVRNAPFVMQNGDVHWVQVTKTALRNAAGKVTGVLGVQHDVTEILHSARLAQDAERMLRTVLNAIPSRVFWKDRNSVYLGCNLEFVKDAGSDSENGIIGKTDFDMLWRSEAEAICAADRKIIETREPQLGLVQLYDVPSGPARWFEVSKLPLINANDEVTGILGIASDVTEQRAAIQQLRASEEKLRSSFETSPLGVTLTTVDGRFLEANDAFLKIVGYDRDVLMTLGYQHLSAPDYAESDQRHVEILAETGRYGPYEKEYVRQDGSRISVSINGSMITDADGVGYVWSTVEDITIRRAAEDAQRQLKDDLERLVAERTADLTSAMEGLMRAEKLASLGSLVAGVAHEISTPVGNASLATSTMSGSIAEFEQQMAEKLTRTALDAFVKQVKLGTDIANRNIERVAGLIQSFKQVAVDQTSSQRRQFHLTEIVDEIATTMHPSIKRSAAKLDLSIPGNIVLDSYPGPLGQILTNLINNSLLHAFPEGRSGTISIAASQPAPESVCIHIKDDGIGIPAASLGRIFDPFFTSKLGRGGSGLGLHIVHNIMTGILAGNIAVSSEVGVGTTFTLTMPLRAPQQASA